MIKVKITLHWFVWLVYVATSVTFLVLKLNHTVTWSWVAAPSPLWGLGAACGLIAFILIPHAVDA